jgi:hypothetical protein
MRRLLLFAVGVERLAEFPDCLALGVGAGWEWELKKALRVVVVGVISHAEKPAGSHSPHDMRST